MNKKIIFFLLFIVFAFLIGGANAEKNGRSIYAEYHPTEGYIFVYGGEANGSTLYNNMWNQSSSSWDTDHSIMKHNKGEYRLLKNLGYGFAANYDNGYGYLNLTNDVIDFNKSEGAFNAIGVILNNTTLKSDKGVYANTYSLSVWSDIKDVTVDGFRRIHIINTNPQFNITNLTMRNIFDGLYMDSFTSGASISNSTFKNIYIYNCGNTSGEPWYGGSAVNYGDSPFYLRGQGNNNITIDNVTYDKLTPFGSDFTGSGGDRSGTGFSMDGGRDYKISNVTLNGAGRSGFGLTGNLYNTTCTNIYVKNAQHNNFDFHGQHDVVLRNYTSIDAYALGFLITGWAAYAPFVQNDTGRTMWDCTHDMYLYDGYIEGNALEIENAHTVLIQNLTVNGSSLGTYFTCKNFTMINVTLERYPGTSNSFSMTLGRWDSGTPAIAPYQQMNDSKFIDCNYPSGMTVHMLHTDNISFINTNNAGYSIEWEYPNEATSYYYPNLKVVNVTGYPVSNVTITVNTTTRNGFGNIQSTYRTDSTGRLYDSGNRSNWLAVPCYEFHGMNATTYSSSYYIPEITATKNGQNAYEIVNPDISWYSPNPEFLQGKLITLILDTKGVGPSSKLPVANFNVNVTSGFVPLSENYQHLDGDVNRDGIVNSQDINEISKHYGNSVTASYPDWDVNQDGVINLQDLIIVESHFGEKLE